MANKKKGNLWDDLKAGANRLYNDSGARDVVNWERNAVNNAAKYASYATRAIRNSINASSNATSGEKLPSADSPPRNTDNNGGDTTGGATGTVGGASSFDASPYDMARGRVNTQTDAARRLIAQMQAELVTNLSQRANEYQAAAAKLQQDMQGYGQQAQQTNTADLQAVQNDLGAQGANVQAIAAQAQAQEQARAQAQARQQDYLSRLAAVAAQNTADRKASANTMFAGLNSQAELLRNQQLAGIDQAMIQAMRGGGRGGGGGGRSSSSGDLTASEQASQMAGADKIANMLSYSGTGNYWDPYASTLYGPGQQRVKNALQQYIDLYQSGGAQAANQFRSRIESNLGGAVGNKYNQDRWREAIGNLQSKLRQDSQRIANINKYFSK